MKMARFSTMLIIFQLISFTACQKNCQQVADTSKKGVHFISPSDGEKVPQTFEMKFAVEGMQIRPAGEDPEDQNSGHFHVLVDEEGGFTEKGVVVGEDATHIHYGKGQTEAAITLPIGKHTLTLQFSDGAHRSYGKEMAHHITVYVTGEK